MYGRIVHVLYMKRHIIGREGCYLLRWGKHSQWQCLAGIKRSGKWTISPSSQLPISCHWLPLVKNWRWGSLVDIVIYVSALNKEVGTRKTGWIWRDQSENIQNADIPDNDSLPSNWLYVIGYLHLDIIILKFNIFKIKTVIFIIKPSPLF